MRCDRTLLANLLMQRAGLSAEQIEAVRRGEVGAVLHDLAEPAAQTNVDAMEDAVARALRRLELLERRLERSNEFLLALARLVGACERCWGTNDACPTCRGVGSPGFREPEAALGAWIDPALQRISPAPTTEPSPGEVHRKEHEHA